MLHSENQVEAETDEEIHRRSRIGVWLLLVFATVYFVFIGLCAFANQWFAASQFYGVPATVCYGMGLIVLALIIAGIYGRLCR